MPLAAAVLICAVPPLLLSDSFLRVGSLFFLQLTLMAGLFVVTGLTRVISLCHAALAGVGAYVSAIVALHYGFWPMTTIVIGALAATVIAFLLSQITRAVADHYLTLATLAASEILTNIFRSATAITGGANGLADIPPVGIGGVILSRPYQSYPLCAVIGIGAVVFIWLLDRSQLGRALRAVGDEGWLVESLGVSQSRLRATGFAVGGALAGLAGAVAAHVDGFVGPESFGVSHSVSMLCFLAVVGLRSLRGVFLAAAFVSFAQEFLREFLQWQMIIVAGLALAVLYFRSVGLPAWVTAIFGRRIVKILQEGM